MDFSKRNKKLKEFGVILERCTIKDLYLFETEGIVPDTSDITYFNKIKKRKESLDYICIDSLVVNPVLTNKKFWVGVKSGKYPSPPIPRRMTNCFVPIQVYEFDNRFIFKYFNKGFKQHWYLIPKSEEIFIS